MKVKYPLCCSLLLASCATAQSQSGKIQDQLYYGQWTVPAKNYASTRHSTITDLNTSTVKNLKLAWTFSTGFGCRGHWRNGQTNQAVADHGAEAF